MKIKKITKYTETNLRNVSETKMMVLKPTDKILMK